MRASRLRERLCTPVLPCASHAPAPTAAPCLARSIARTDAVLKEYTLCIKNDAAAQAEGEPAEEILRGMLDYEAGVAWTTSRPGGVRLARGPPAAAAAGGAGAAAAAAAARGGEK